MHTWFGKLPATPQIEETSLIADITIPGRQSSITQFLESISRSLRLEGVLTTSSAKIELSKLQTYKCQGIPIQAKIQTHNQTWTEDYYIIEKLE